MKNKSPNRGSSYFLMQRIHGKDLYNRPASVKPELKGTEIELENILRWEDDGGQMLLDVGNSKDWSNRHMAREQAND